MNRIKHSDNHDHSIDDEDVPIPEAPHLQGIRAIPYNSILNETIHLTEKESLAAIIPLDGTVKSDLNWNEAYKIADACIKNGAKIIFNLDLGLFDRLEHSLAHQGQFQALALSCDHFRRDVVPRFDSNLLGVIMYEGALNMAHHKTHLLATCWDEFIDWLISHSIIAIPKNEQEVGVSPILRWYYKRFCHEQCIELLRTLSLQIPDTNHRFILLDSSQGTHSVSPYETARQIAKDLVDPLSIVLKNGSFIVDCSIWEKGIGTQALFSHNTVKDPSAEFLNSDIIPTAILIPQYQTIEEGVCTRIRQATDFLADRGISKKIRVVNESYFTSEWNGLDTLVYSQQSLSAEGQRSIKGFEAAGGYTINIDEESGMQELFKLNP